MEVGTAVSHTWNATKAGLTDHRQAPPPVPPRQRVRLQLMEPSGLSRTTCSALPLPTPPPGGQVRDRIHPYLSVTEGGGMYGGGRGTRPGRHLLDSRNIRLHPTAPPSQRDVLWSSPPLPPPPGLCAAQQCERERCAGEGGGGGGRGETADTLQQLRRDSTRGDASTAGRRGERATGRPA